MTRLLTLDITAPLRPDELFGNDRPLEIDVGCGKGRFLLARAAACPQTNFLGIDRMLRRLRKVDRKLRRAGLANVRLVRLEAAYVLERMLPDNSVDTFYIFFPDPWPKRRHHPRRLFNEAFLDTLDRTLKPGGTVHAATDHLEYFEQIRALFEADNRFDVLEPFVPAPDEQTEFERTFLALGQPIGRGSYRRKTPTSSRP
jgi:tRNA (guanine-N7-)-methyltransferase